MRRFRMPSTGQQWGARLGREQSQLGRSSHDLGVNHFLGVPVVVQQLFAQLGNGAVIPNDLRERFCVVEVVKEMEPFLAAWN